MLDKFIAAMLASACCVLLQYVDAQPGDAVSTLS
jgi:hypothetical protein